MPPKTTLFGAGAPATPVVIIQPATAVPESFYTPFAEFLAEQGFRAVTYNYRGVGREAGDSSSRLLRMRDWADVDVNAVIDEVRDRFPGAPLAAIGHSFGGHAVGLSDQSRHLKAAVLIASHAGSMRFIQPWTERMKATLLLHVLGPAVATALGYLPGKRLGIGEDLSAGVMHEWRRWTKLRHYFFDDPSLGAAERFARIECPILCYSFADDPWATEPAITELVRHFKNAQVTRRRIDSKQHGSGSIGHLGFFHRRHCDQLWPPITDWLRSVLNPLTP